MRRSLFRSLWIAVALGLIGLGIYLSFHSNATISGGIWCCIIGTMLLIAALFENHIYKPLVSTPPANAQRTDEQFIDPATGQKVAVYFDPDTGERTYVASDISKPQ